MTYALYLDPCKKSVTPELPEEAPSLAYWRLIDCSDEQLNEFLPENYPQAGFTIAEIHPAQLDVLQVPVNRISIVQQKSVFHDLAPLRTRLQDIQCDITFNWDKRFSVDYYLKILRFWLQCGVQHISFYELTDFDKWQRLQSILAQHNFHFYDRYHACLPGYESPYQKHIAGFGNLYAIGGWSRMTEGNQTHVKGPVQKTWDLLSEEDQIVEKLLFAFADRDGMEMEVLKPYLTSTGLSKAMASGLVTMKGSRVVPTDLGLWDTVNLVSQLHNN
jgi:hypothetical protein